MCVAKASAAEVNGTFDIGHDHNAGFGDDMELEEQRLELIEELLSCSSVDEMAMQEAVDVLLCLGQDVQASSLSDPTEVSVAKHHSLCWLVLLLQLWQRSAVQFSLAVVLISLTDIVAYSAHRLMLLPCVEVRGTVAGQPLFHSMPHLLTGECFAEQLDSVKQLVYQAVLICMIWLCRMRLMKEPAASCGGGSRKPLPQCAANR